MNDFTTADFAERLLATRRRRGLKRADVARAAGTSPTVLGRYERGDRTPTVETARALARALDVSLDYLAGDADAALRDPQMVDRLDAIAALPETPRQTLLDVLDAYLRDHKAKAAYAA